MEEKIVKFRFADGFHINEFTVKIAGENFEMDEVNYKRISNDVHLFRITFIKPKHFEIVSGDSITIIPRDDIKSQLNGVIQIEIFSDENDKDYIIFCKVSRNIIDAALIKKSLFNEGYKIGKIENKKSRKI